MIESPKADDLLSGPLGAWLDEQAGLRADVRAKGQRRFTVAVTVAAILVFVLILRGSDISTAVLLGAMVGLGGFAWVKWTEQPVVSRIKAGMNTALAAALGLDYSTVVTDQGPFERGCRYELLPAHDHATVEDQWSGELGGHGFCLHEVRLTEERGSGKNRRTVTVFAGCLIAVRFARPFTGFTVIRRRARVAGLVKSLFGMGDSITIADRPLQRVDLVDPRFSDSFEAWTSDPVDGHYLLNPAYVERLIALEQAFHGDQLRAVFAAGELLIALETEDLFESGAIDAAGDRQRLDQTIGQFTTLADLALRLNERPR